MGKLSWWKTILLLCVFCAVEVMASPAQTFTTLLSFNWADGAGPAGVLVQGTDGNLYGTTGFGGANLAYGTVYKITPAGTLTTLHSFDGSDGISPNGGLAEATNGNFYGTAYYGGTDISDCPGGCGTVFKITRAGTLIWAHSFDLTDGWGPAAGLVQATNGIFYGSTVFGGANDYGTVFEITPAGTLTTLHSFDGSDGSGPNGGLVEAPNGDFYGTTYGGAISAGTVFEMTARGELRTIYSFCTKTNCIDGAIPNGGLVQATDGDFYGTTEEGGASSNCSGGCGTVFKITPAGVLTTLHSFDGTDGAGPSALVLGTDGNFYGTTYSGGANDGPGCDVTGIVGCGTVFKITPGGKLKTLHSFDISDGRWPGGGLVEATSGSFYGATSYGGATGDGTVFSLSVGLGPFVEALTYSGKVGNTIEFLGQGFTSSTKVSFNGKAAIRTVVSGTYLTATVPNDATTGFVTVTTSEGTLRSNKIFRVIPQITSFTPTSGPVGTCVEIAGESLEGATTVTFNGVEAKFTVDSYTRIMATVPKGAKTGTIEVTTAGGMATSPGTFTVN
jgi:uncharacterized repeat protein (TIGR03803 family)